MRGRGEGLTNGPNDDKTQSKINPANLENAHNVGGTRGKSVVGHILVDLLGEGEARGAVVHRAQAPDQQLVLLGQQVAVAIQLLVVLVRLRRGRERARRESRVNCGAVQARRFVMTCATNQMRAK